MVKVVKFAVFQRPGILDWLPAWFRSHRRLFCRHARPSLYMRLVRSIVGGLGGLGNPHWLGCLGRGYVRYMAPDDLDDLSGIPRYRQIAAIVEREIRSGQWEPGSPAPSRTVLMQRFGVAGETARRAQAWLADRGYLVSVPGVGMVVTPEDRWPDKL